MKGNIMKTHITNLSVERDIISIDNEHNSIYTYPIWSNMFNKILLLECKIVVFEPFLSIKIYLHNSRISIIDTEDDIIINYYCGVDSEEHILSLMKNNSIPDIDTMNKAYLIDMLNDPYTRKEL